MIRLLLCTWLATLLSVLLPAQSAARPSVEALEAAIPEARVRDVVFFLASDELMGRDSPSPGLLQAADYLAAQFAAAGLEQAVEGSWFHRYRLPGQRLDSGSVALTLKVVIGEQEQRIECRPDEDVRLWRAGEITAGRDQDALVAPAGDPRVQRMLMADAGRRPVLLEVASDAHEWRSAAGVRDVLTLRQRGAYPVFVLRPGLLPPIEKIEDAAFTATWSIAMPEAVDIELPNVVGVLRGSSKPDEYVVVSAHYDHIGVGPAVAGDTIRNGADDDASGTTAVVLLAEALAKQPRPARSIAFVCFSAEEKGLRGSAAFVAQPPFALEQIVANLNIEMIGRPEPGKRFRAWITGSQYSDFAAIAAEALQGTGVELTEFARATALFSASDNLSFARRGIVAHSISAGSLHADYHQPSDEAGKLDLEHMTRVIRALAMIAFELADRKARPAFNEQGQQFVRRAGGR